MRFLNDSPQQLELTYSDVFMVPQKSTIESRFDVSINPNEIAGVTLPIVVANMNAVAGKRMAETVARRGGLTVIPQDVPLDIVEKMVTYVQSCHPIYETPITLKPNDTIARAMDLIHKRAHRAVIINDNQQPVGILQNQTPMVLIGLQSSTK